MGKLAAAEAQSDANESDRYTAAHPTETDAIAAGMAAGMVVRTRRLMIISALTTLLAISAVVGVIGYRVFHGRGSGAAATAEDIIVLPKGARVIATTVAGERIVVTLDIAGSTEIRIFDVKTLKEVGRIRFATE